MNSGKEAKECLNLLVTRLKNIQSDLTEDYQKKMLLESKLLNAVKDNEGGKLAYYKPADDLENIISDLQSSLAAVPYT